MENLRYKINGPNLPGILWDLYNNETETENDVRNAETIIKRIVGKTIFSRSKNMVEY